MRERTQWFAKAPLLFNLRACQPADAGAAALLLLQPDLSLRLSPAPTLWYTQLEQALVPAPVPWYRRIASTMLCSGLHSSISNAVKITVNPDARAVFNPVATSGCVPFTITPSIINLVADNNNISEYRWYINERFIGSGQSFPGFTMTNAGDSITVKLVAVSRFGCKNDSSSRGFVTVERPAPSFAQSDTAGCGPLLVTFTNNTPNASRYTYNWNF